MIERGGNQAGLSVIEVAVVIMVAGIMIAVSLPAMSRSIEAYNVRSAADHVAQRLMAARTLAMTKNKQVAISFNYASGLYGYDFTPAGAPDGVPDRSDPDDPATNYYPEKLPDGIRFVFPSNSNITVTFNSRGELPIGASDQAILIRGYRSYATIRVNLRGNVWVTTN
jgi:type II secretory pathway pseudopilin PulG